MFTVFLIFKCTYIRVFWPMILGFPASSVFGPIPIKAPVSLGSLQFRSRLGPHFKVDFSSIFGRGFCGGLKCRGRYRRWRVKKCQGSGGTVGGIRSAVRCMVTRTVAEVKSS
jgi:hypothetical protein